MLKNRKEIAKLSLIMVLFSVVSVLYIFIPGSHGYNAELFKKITRVELLTIFLVGGLCGIGSYLLQILLSNKKADSSTMGLGAMNIIGLLVGMSMFGVSTLMAFDSNNIFIIIIFISSFSGVVFIWLVSKYLFKNSNYILVTGLVLTLVASALGDLIISRTNINIIGMVNPYIVGDLMMDTTKKITLFHIIAISTLVIAILYLLVYGNKVVMAAADEGKAKSLGININLHKFISLMIIAATSASAFLLAGNVMFIGFAVGNLNYKLFKTKLRFSTISVVLLGGMVAIFSYWVFVVELKFSISGSFGVACIIGSGILLFATIIWEEFFKWIKTMK